MVRCCEGYSKPSWVKYSQLLANMLTLCRDNISYDVISFSNGFTIKNDHGIRYKYLINKLSFHTLFYAIFMNSHIFYEEIKVFGSKLRVLRYSN
jgi:hypothetical protein